MRFTIRDLLWLTTLVAVSLGLLIAWSRDSYRLMMEINEKNQLHHDELERREQFWANEFEEVERRTNAVWLRELRQVQKEKGETEPATLNRP
jgi:hypothetical protein